MKLALRFIGLSIAILSISASNAAAHRLGESYIFLQVYKDRIEGRVELNADDADDKFQLDQNRDGKFSKEEVEQKMPQIREYVSERFRIADGDAPYELEYLSDFSMMEINIGNFIKVPFQTKSNLKIPDKVKITYEVFFDHDPSLEGLLVTEIIEQLEVENYGEIVSLVFTPDEPTHELNLTKPPKRRGLKGIILYGMDHILHGLDHILFLLALLLASVMKRDSKPYEPVESFQGGLWNVVKIATVFTVAHSITLGLAATNTIHIESWIVESIIAASIVIAAFDNLVPLFGKRMLFVVFLFGLFHGMGFAGELAYLAKTQISLVKTLFGFNIGVELGQLVIICIGFPILFFIRKASFYSPVVLKAGSIVLMGLGLIWLIERSADITIIGI